jgi:hypothetical protein
VRRRQSLIVLTVPTSGWVAGVVTVLCAVTTRFAPGGRRKWWMLN